EIQSSRSLLPSGSRIDTATGGMRLVSVACTRSDMIDLLGSPGVTMVLTPPTGPCVDCALHVFVALNASSKRRSIVPWPPPAGRWQCEQFACKYERARASSGSAPDGSGSFGS